MVTLSHESCLANIENIVRWLADHNCAHEAMGDWKLGELNIPETTFDRIFAGRQVVDATNSYGSRTFTLQQDGIRFVSNRYRQQSHVVTVEAPK